MSSATRPQLQYLHEAIEDLKAKHLYFNLKILEGEQKPVANFDGKEVINLSSNNYLGLTTHPKLRRAAIDATRKFGVGSGAVRTIAGTMKMHMDLEAQIANFKKVEACVVFQSGFAANAGTVSAILGKETANASCRKPKTGTARNCSSPTAFFPWTATSPISPRSATSPKNIIAS